MSEQRGEKDEKAEEKRHEKSVEEKWVRDPVSLVSWAAVLIWAGVVLLVENLSTTTGYRWRDTGAVIFTGAGIIMLLQALVRLAVPHYRRSIGGAVVLGIIFLGIGLGGLFGWNVTWPIVLIAIGLFIILGGLFRRRRNQ